MQLTIASLAVTAGFFFTYLFDEDASFSSRMFAGVPIGFAIIAFAGFITTPFVTFEKSILLAGLACACSLVLLIKAAVRSQVCADWAKITLSFKAIFTLSRRSMVTLGTYSFLAAVLCLALARVMFTKSDGIYTGFTNNLGDLPFHLQIITSFVNANNFPPNDPTYTGSRFTYPFLADLLTAIFVRADASLRGAQFMQSFCLLGALMGLLYRWAYEMTGDRLASAIAPILVVFSGGLGWFNFLRDTWSSPQGPWHVLLHPPRDYTIIAGTGWRWGNALTTLLVPQRSILFGLPIALIIFTQWWLVLRDSFQTDSSTRKIVSRRMLASGVLAGILPLVHTHTWMIVMAMAAFMALIFRKWGAWVFFLIPAVVLAAPQVTWMLHGSAVRTSAFWEWHFGWDRGNENAFWFWFKNTGLFIPALVAAVLWRRKEKYLAPPRLMMFYAPFTLCFLVPNVVTLAPWVWDNIKVLFFWYIASVPFVSLLLAYWLRQRPAWRLVAGIVLLALTFAGSLDIWRIISKSTEFKEFGAEGVTIAAQILERTEPRALILHAAVYDSPVYLTGRPSLLGYPGWAWTRGLDPAERETAIKHIYAGSKEAVALVKLYRVKYILLGPQELMTMPVNYGFLSRYSKIAVTPNYELYTIE
jgi:hypothetical protein